MYMRNLYPSSTMPQLHVYALLAAVALQSAADWVVLDDGYVTRQGDRATLTRQGPWAQFTQRFVRLESGRPADAGTIERLGVNCLTGAFGATRYLHVDSNSKKPTTVNVSMNEIEHRPIDAGRLLLSNNSSELGNAIIGMACNCPAALAAKATPTDVQTHALYDRYMAEPMSTSVFDQYASPVDARNFVHGKLGTTLETDLPANIVTVGARKPAIGKISSSRT